MSAFEPIIVQSDDRSVKVWEFGEDNHIRCLASAVDTAGRLSFFENRLSPGAAIPLHVHHHEDEYWYVFDDGLKLRLGTKMINVKAKTLIAIPAGTEHAVFNTGPKVAGAVYFTTPGGLEAFFEGVSNLLGSLESEPADFIKLYKATGTTIIS
jgi:mannose-6-phosphate isomerase-like protein (cupin superfamily)